MNDRLLPAYTGKHFPQKNGETSIIFICNTQRVDGYSSTFPRHFPPMVSIMEPFFYGRRAMRRLAHTPRASAYAPSAHTASGRPLFADGTVALSERLYHPQIRGRKRLPRTSLCNAIFSFFWFFKA
jgi:hypothetical protein